jgi:hypothetical protein
MANVSEHFVDKDGKKHTLPIVNYAHALKLVKCALQQAGCSAETLAQDDRLYTILDRSVNKYPRQSIVYHCVHGFACYFTEINLSELPKHHIYISIKGKNLVM